MNCSRFTWHNDIDLGFAMSWKFLTPTGTAWESHQPAMQWWELKPGGPGTSWGSLISQTCTPWEQNKGLEYIEKGDLSKGARSHTVLSDQPPQSRTKNLRRWREMKQKQRPTSFSSLTQRNVKEHSRLHPWNRIPEEQPSNGCFLGPCSLLSLESSAHCLMCVRSFSRESLSRWEGLWSRLKAHCLSTCEYQREVYGWNELRK